MKWNKFILSFLTLISCVSCGRPDTEYNNFYFQSSIFYFATLYQYKTLWIKNYDQENKDYLNYKTNDDLLNLIKDTSIYTEVKDVVPGEKYSYYLFFSNEIPETDSGLEYKYYIYPNNVISIYHDVERSEVFGYDHKVAERFYTLSGDNYDKVINLITGLLDCCRC